MSYTGDNGGLARLRTERFVQVYNKVLDRVLIEGDKVHKEQKHASEANVGALSKLEAADIGAQAAKRGEVRSAF